MEQWGRVGGSGLQAASDGPDSEVYVATPTFLACGLLHQVQAGVGFPEAWWFYRVKQQRWRPIGSSLSVWCCVAATPISVLAAEVSCLDGRSSRCRCLVGISQWLSS